MARLTVAIVLLAVALFYFKPNYNQIVLNYLKQWLPSRPSCLPSNETLFTADLLKEYDGQDVEKGVYLSFLGVVYIVTRGIKHYGMVA